jgi:hypothetical protein
MGVLDENITIIGPSIILAQEGGFARTQGRPSLDA